MHPMMRNFICCCTPSVSSVYMHGYILQIMPNKQTYSGESDAKVKAGHVRVIIQCSATTRGCRCFHLATSSSRAVHRHRCHSCCRARLSCCGAVLRLRGVYAAAAVAGAH